MFERLRVEEFVAMTIKGRRRKWRCTCSCGNEVIVGSSELVRHQTNSCGCYRDDKSRDAQHKRRQDLTGKQLKYGGYVLGPSTKYKVRKSGDRYHLWRCQCPCGAEFLAIAAQIVGGRKSFCSRTCPHNTRKRRPKGPDYVSVREALKRPNGYKYVSADEKAEITLAAGQGDKRAAELLIMLYDRWVWQNATKYATTHRSKGELVVEELVQECRIALLEAARRWDPTRGAFTTYAHWWLLHAMGLEANSGTSGIDVPVNAHLGKRTREHAINAHKVVSLDMPIGDDSDQTFKDALEDRTEAPEFDPEDIDALPALIARLPEPQRVAIEFYYLGEKTLEEVGAERGVTRERIRQLVVGGLKKLKKWMAQRERP